MTGEQIIFLVVALFTLGSALMVVTTRNLIHAALWLVSTLFGVAVIYTLLNAGFMAVVQVVVYIGAIAILIVFAVMLTRSMTRMIEILNGQWLLSAIVGAGLFLLLVIGVILPTWGNQGLLDATVSAPSQVVIDTVDLGKALVDRNGFVLPFEVASLLLTAAMIGAIVIARDDTE